MPEVYVAGELVVDSFGILVGYARRERTLTTYDLAGTGEPTGLTRDEVVRTRVIASRISNKELAWLLERGESAPWTDVPRDADLRDADPDEEAGVYDRAHALYDHFHAPSPRGINHAKVSKVLHLKRPALYPVLDSQVMARYQRHARRAALRHPQRGYRRMYWAAIRDDLHRSTPGLAQLRAWCAAHDREGVRRLSELSDLRLHDILTWPGD